MNLSRALRNGLDRILDPNVSIAPIYTEAPPLPRRIPNVVYQTWREPRLQRTHAQRIARFRQLNPDYSFRLYDDAAMAAYMRTHFGNHPICAVFDQIQIMAAKADIWRYCVLYREGGVYCDIDSALSIPVSSILETNPSEAIAFEANPCCDQMEPGAYADSHQFLRCPSSAAQSLLQFPDHAVLNWFLCFEAGHPLLAEVIEVIVKNFEFYRTKAFHSGWKAVIHATGPLALTQATWRYLDRTGARLNQCGIDFYRTGIFKLKGSDKRFAVSPHYAKMSDLQLCDTPLPHAS